MKKIFAVLILLLLGSPGWAQDKIKIGVFDLQIAISESKAGKKARARFRDQVKKAEVEILKEKNVVERLKSDIDKKGPLLKPQERRNLEREFQRRYKGFQRKMRDHQEELQQREGEMTAEIIKEIQRVVLEFGKKENFTLIFEHGGVLYYDEAINLTKTVIELYDRSSTRKVTKAK
ncbi:MAG: OmpH family outer membrane protein [Deltaproteobacteria bacterium]|nr:OmpH family outer membrane protein [Deltaproteobacteria bacterium]